MDMYSKITSRISGGKGLSLGSSCTLESLSDVGDSDEHISIMVSEEAAPERGGSPELQIHAVLLGFEVRSCDIQEGWRDDGFGLSAEPSPETSYRRTDSQLTLDCCECSSRLAEPPSFCKEMRTMKKMMVIPAIPARMARITPPRVKIATRREIEECSEEESAEESVMSQLVPRYRTTTQVYNG